MTRTEEVSTGQLLQRRDDLLSKVGMDLQTFADRAQSFRLVGDEWNVWDELRNIAFLLGDDKS
ncbi:hypothetical protein OG943_01065 [Amycolatopsis sp. NBC_00345]|uniref:hypothetical protein n=1 Tax=Amycolatopsis sp. NBC_00345 TaxID=2975955 RepID=UPI002E25AD77